jgi:hypothetical protein
MLGQVIILTNNPLSNEKLKGIYDVELIEGSMVEVLRNVRDYIHKNHRLLTHPLVSSIKPNEMPYRTVIISKESDTKIDMQSLELIENSINTTEKFLRDFGIPNWNEKILKDFQLIDYDIIYNVLK